MNSCFGCWPKIYLHCELIHKKANFYFGIPKNKWLCKMGLSTMLYQQPSKDKKRAKKRQNRSVSPKRTRSSKSRRNSLTTDISCTYPLENKIRRSSRNASTRQSHRHHRHKKVSPSRRKVKMSLHVTKYLLKIYKICSFTISILN